MDIVQTCSTQLKNIPEDKGHHICLKMEDVLQKIKDIKFCQVYKKCYLDMKMDIYK